MINLIILIKKVLIIKKIHFLKKQKKKFLIPIVLSRTKKVKFYLNYKVQKNKFLLKRLIHNGDLNKNKTLKLVE